MLGKPSFIFIFTYWEDGLLHGLQVKRIVPVNRPKAGAGKGITWVTCLLFVWMGCSLVHGQSNYRFITDFERDINRYRWHAGIQIDQPINSWSLQLHNQFTSDAFILFNNLLSFRDENTLVWTLKPGKVKKLTPGVRGYLASYSQSRVFTQTVYGTLNFSVRNALSIEPFLGIAMDHRPGIIIGGQNAPLRRDAGPAFGTILSVPKRIIGGYNVELDAQGNVQLITPRRGRLIRARGRGERFFDKTRFGSEVSYSNVRRDTYQSVSFLNRDSNLDPISETIEATTSDTLLVRVELETPISSSLQLINRLDYSSNNRRIRTLRTPEESLFFDTNFTRRSVDIEIGLAYQTPKLTSQFTFTGATEVEQRQLENRDELPPIQATQKGDLLEQADYDRSILGIQTRNIWSVSEKFSLNLEATANILRHDTPVSNQDDRDESFFSGQFGMQYRLNPYVTMQLSLFGTYYHTVYLKARRSAENNVQRSLRFRPTVILTPSPSTYARVRSEVRATYTVDDFVLEGRRPTDQSARELQYEAEIRQDITSKYQVLLNLGSSDLHLGRFLRDSFAEIPFDTLRTYSGWARIRTTGKVQGEIGMRLFIRTDFERSSTVRYRRLDENGNIELDEAGSPVFSTITRTGRRWIEQIGPTSAIIWSMQNSSELRVDGWLNVQHIRQRLYGDLPGALADHIQSEARKGTRKVIPNLSVSVRWNL